MIGKKIGCGLKCDITLCDFFLLLGEILEYNLYHNGLSVYSATEAERSLGHVISGLAPWSLHVIRMEACTVQGCGSSGEVQARTQVRRWSGMEGFFEGRGERERGREGMREGERYERMEVCPHGNILRTLLQIA